MGGTTGEVPAADAAPPAPARAHRHLIETYFQFGRYLLASSSRPGSLPANLQGIWADQLQNPWQSDYHLNINTTLHC